MATNPYIIGGVVALTALGAATYYVATHTDKKKLQAAQAYIASTTNQVKNTLTHALKYASIRS